MSSIIAIDTGLHNCGVAVVQDGILTHGWLSRRGAGEYMSEEVCIDINQYIGATFTCKPWELVIEKPRIRKQNQQKGRQKDIEDLLIMVGRIEVRCALQLQMELVGTQYYPENWKGQLTKAIHHRRMTKDLDEQHPEWRDCISKCPAGLLHNVYDAMGIARHHDRVLTNRSRNA